MLLCRMGLVSFRMFRKNLSNLRKLFLGKWFTVPLPPPPRQKIARTPMNKHFLTTIQDDCKRRTLFRVFRGHVVFEGIYFFFCICDNRPWHFLRCPFCVLFGSLNFVLLFSGRVHRISCFLVVASERGFSCPSKNF